LRVEKVDEVEGLPADGMVEWLAVARIQLLNRLNLSTPNINFALVSDQTWRI
jgi:hypothetical protein